MKPDGVSSGQVWAATLLCRHSNVSSQAILPTWVPFRTTMLSEEKLVFSLRLMEGKHKGMAEGGYRDSSGSLSPLAMPFRGLEL